MSCLLNCSEEILDKIACKVMKISEQYGKWESDEGNPTLEYTLPE